MGKDRKIDISLLKKLVGELENHLNVAEGIRKDEADIQEYIVEMSRAAGLAAGVMSEAALLIGDIHAGVKSVQQVSAKNDFLDKLLGGLKGPGTSN